MKCQRDLSKKKKIKTMNSKKTTSSQLPTTEPKKQKQTQQTAKTGRESQKWRAHGALLVGWWENRGTGTENKSTIGRYKIGGGLEQCKKWRSQITYMYNPWT